MGPDVSPPPEQAPHPDVEPVAFLLGAWRGQGHGAYPTIESFDYGEEVRFRHVGKPFLAYTQRTWALEDQRPLHSEMGYWRPGSAGTIEIVLAHPTGIVEIQEGTIEGGTIRVESRQVGLTTTAKDVAHLRREFRVDGDMLSYDLWMAAVGVPLTHHLHADLRRI